MKKENTKIKKMVSAVGITGFSMATVSGLMGSLFIVGHAADIFDVAKSMMNSVLTSVQGISTILACVCIAICALILIFTKDQKASDGALSWLKRIILAVILINSVGSVLSYITDKLNSSGAQKTI